LQIKKDSRRRAASAAPGGVRTGIVAAERSIAAPLRGGDGTLCGKHIGVAPWPGAALAAYAASLAPVYNTPAASRLQPYKLENI